MNMRVKVFNSLRKMQKYYDKKSNTYDFLTGSANFDLVVFNFDLNVNANILAYDIRGMDIRALDIRACDIKARDINVRNIEAVNISYYAACVAYQSIKCKSIKGRLENSKHFVLYGKLEVEEENN